MQEQVHQNSWCECWRSTPRYQDNIEFVTIASTGNASDFGDLTGNCNLYGAVQIQTLEWWICTCCF